MNIFKNILIYIWKLIKVLFLKIYNFIKKTLMWILDFVKKMWPFLVLFIGLTYLLKSDFYLDFLINQFGEYGAILLAITIYLVSAITTILVVAFLTLFQEWMSQYLYSRKTDSKKKLFTWLSQDIVSNIFLYDCFKDSSDGDYNDIENIKKVVKILKLKLNYNLVNYKLFKNHLEHKTKKSFFKKFNFALLTIVSSFATLKLMPVIHDEIINQIKEKITLFNSTPNSIIFMNLIILMSICIMVYFFAYQMSLFFTDSGRRVKYLISILDILIEEEENKSS